MNHKCPKRNDSFVGLPAEKFELPVCVYATKPWVRLQSRRNLLPSNVTAEHTGQDCNNSVQDVSLNGKHFQLNFTNSTKDKTNFSFVRVCLCRHQNKTVTVRDELIRSHTRFFDFTPCERHSKKQRLNKTSEQTWKGQAKYFAHVTSYSTKFCSKIPFTDAALAS